MIIIKNRKLLIPEYERYIGTTADSNSEVLTFRIDRYTQTEMDLSAFTAKADIYRCETEETDRADLEMEVQDNYILLYLYITSDMVAYPGTILIDIKAFNDDGTVKWSSYKGAFYVEDPFTTPQATLENLTELEQLEARINRAIATAYEKAAKVVSEWLEQNIGEIEGYVIDKSLSVSDAAADALTVGRHFKSTGFISKTVDSIRPYPLVVSALYDADSSEFSSAPMSQQSMAVERDANGRAQYIYMISASGDNMTAEVSKFRKEVDANGYVTWAFANRKYIVNALGHADGAMFMNGSLWIRNGRTIHEVNPSTLGLTGISVDITAFSPRGMAYDPVTDKIVMTASTRTSGKTLDTLYFLDTNFSVVKTVYVKTMDNYIAQDCGFYDGIVYVIAGNYGYSSGGIRYSVDTGLSSGTNIMCYTEEGEYLKSIPVEGYCGEVESVDTDGAGYIYLSVNNGYAGVPSSPLGMTLEAPLFTDAIESLRTPIYEKPSTVGAPTFDANIYLDSEVGSVKCYGVGLGLREKPFRSFFAASLAIHKLNEAGVKSVYLHIMHTGSPNIYDCALRIVGNSSNIYVYDDNNNSYDGITEYKIGGFEAVDSSYIDIRGLGIKPPVGTVVGLSNPIRILRVNMVAIRRCKLYGGAGNLNRIEGSLIYLDGKNGFFDGELNIFQSTIEESADCEIERTTVVYTGHNLGDGRWSNFNLNAVTDEIAKAFKYKLATVDSVTINDNGYVDVGTYAPAVPEGYELFTSQIWALGSISTKTAITFEAKGKYIYGSAGAVVKNLILYYIYIKRGYFEKLS